ncbi:MAG: ABC transporter permease [Actinomycetota bacterium]|nr:ABC transporter permease [Actinomycetota bacterium]
MSRIQSRPLLIIPMLFMPLVLVVSFTGAFSSLTRIPGYGTGSTFNWMTPYAVLQGAMFGGLGGASATAEDMESGFFDRLLLAPGGHLPLLVGTVAYSALRSAIPTTAVLLVAIPSGLDLSGGLLGIGLLYLAAAAMAAVLCLVGLAVVYRKGTMRSVMPVQILDFSMMFMSTGQVPLECRDGWLFHVARLNPATNVMSFARQGFIGDITWGTTWPGLLAMVVMVSATVLSAALSMERMSK